MTAKETKTVNLIFFLKKIKLVINMGVEEEERVKLTASPGEQIERAA